VKRGLVLAVLLAVAAATAYGVLAVERPDPAAQAVADGCPRDLLAVYSRAAPTWVYVNARDGGAPPPQWVKGTVDAGAQPYLGAHPSGADDPISHNAYDFVINVKPDPAYAYLVGGNEVGKTGNFQGEDETASRLHVERESNATPVFSWPDPGDRVEILGSWVWDCGHWKPGGERTELHPWRALWVQRAVSARSPWGEREGDLFVSTESTPAGVIADCALKTKGAQDAFKACLLTQPAWQDVSGDYRFVLPAPPKPPGAGRLRVRVVDQGSVGGAAPTVVIRGAAAVVTMKLAATPGKRLVVAKQVFLGWTKTPAVALPQHLRLSFRSLLVRRAMDPGCPPGAKGCVSVESTLDGQITTAPGEWNLYWDAAGIWGAWSPLVLYTRDGKTYPGTQTVDVYLPRGRPWRFLALARECDFGSLSFGDQAKAPWPCPSSKEFGSSSSDDGPGLVVHRFDSPVASLGLHRDDPIKQLTSCPKSNAHGCYELLYVVTRVNDAVKRAASQPR
jgi:hypothetical protein